ncbi:MAG: hypothetical protein ACLUSP_09165 [Christensenellales bacterium]
MRVSGVQKFGLRAFADNFDPKNCKKRWITRTLSEKVYVTLNIFARESDFGELIEFLPELNKIGRRRYRKRYRRCFAR